MEKLVIIDGNSLLFRAYFAMRPMITKDGVYTQGIYSFINMLNKVSNYFVVFMESLGGMVFITPYLLMEVVSSHTVYPMLTPLLPRQLFEL